MLKELFEYREMLHSLIRKELRGRYKGSVLGFLWTFINPLLQLVVYTIVFSYIMRSDIDQFYIFLFVGLIPWLFFSTSLTGGSTAIIYQENLIKKIYFPRIILPIAFVTSAFINMLLTFIVIFAVLLISGYGINISAIWFLPLIMLVEYLLALGISVLVSALTVFFRDLEYILGILTMAWMYLTPILYTVDMVPEEFRTLFQLNPMTPIIIAYREILYYKRVPQVSTLLHAVGMGIFFIVFGSVIFQHLQKKFVEEL